MTSNPFAAASFAAAAAGVTHVGCVRSHSEDCYHIDEAAGVFAVMDGAGGHDRGAVASGLVKTALARIGRPANAEDLLARFEDRVVRAKSEMDALEKQPGHGGAMGTTIAAILTFGSHFACLWAGDSRAYRLRDGTLEQLTRDHTEVQDLLDRQAITPEEARTWSRRHVITRAIGAGLELQLDIVTGSLRDKDRFMLCSDGLTGHLGDDVIQKALSTGTPAQAAQALVDDTLEHGAQDNVTAVVVDFALVRAGAAQ